MSADPDREDPVAARWEGSGPDPDDPPWAGRQRDDDAREDEGDRPTDDARDPDDVRAHDRETAGGPGSALSRVTGHSPQPPRPPRRTGVFLDPEDLRSHVGDLLRLFLGSYQVDAYGNFTFTHEQARVFVTVGMTPIGPQVGVFSITNLEVALTNELATFLLSTNHQLGFGAFSYDTENQTVWLKHSLLGTMLDGPELQSAVAAVASTAAHFDDQIRDRFGGRVFQEVSEDVQNSTRPPDPGDQPYPNAGGYL